MEEPYHSILALPEVEEEAGPDGHEACKEDGGLVVKHVRPLASMRESIDCKNRTRNTTHHNKPQHNTQ